MKKTNNALAGKLRFNRGAVLASLAMAAMSFGSSEARATVICSGAPFGIPANISGLYVNFVTQTTSPNSGFVVGWDLNAYASVGILRFFSSSSAGNTARYVGTGAVIDVLAPGTMVDVWSVLATTGVVQPGAFQAGVTNGYIGVAFNNEVTATTNYGWASLTTTGPSGFPVTINQYCYQDDGTGIMAGGDGIFTNGFEV